MSLEKVIETARGELGVTEDPPGSNRVKYWEAYDPRMQGQPWCVSFLWWCFRQAGEGEAFLAGGKTASCGTLLRWYRERGQTVPVDQAQAGDILILNFHGTQDTEHCGLAAETADAPSLAVYTVEGNTSPGMEGSQVSGGCVALKMRHGGNIVAVCRPRYRETGETVRPGPAGPAMAPDGGKDDVAGHWAEEDIRWATENGLLRGYPDGSFRPDKPLTRAELAAVLRRMEGAK